jgi:hypothetical protein
MNSYYHAVISAKKYGGKPEDYQKLHDFIDSSKATLADVRHRALLHSAFGVFLCEQVFGHTVTNSDDKKVPVRLLAEEHILEDLGFIPTVEHWLAEMPLRKWMSGTRKKNKLEPLPPSTTINKTEEVVEDTATRYRKNLKCQKH